MRQHIASSLGHAVRFAPDIADTILQNLSKTIW